MKTIDKIRHYYHVMGDLSHMNLILKIALTVVGTCLLFSLLTIVRLATRPPLIITVLPDGNAISTAYDSDSSSTIADSEIERFIRKFLAIKYNWTPQSIESQLKESSKFISPALWKDIQRKISQDIAYGKNTSMTQQFYVKEITPENQSPFKQKKTYTVIGDRVIGIKGAKFTTTHKIVLAIEKNRRSDENLSGLQIISLKEISPPREPKEENHHE